MDICEIKVLRGPNIWSSYRRNLIQMKVDLGIYEELPTNKLEGFCERLQELIPSLYEHECSIEKPGGLFERVREGTWLGHVAEHIALELQSLAGMQVGYGRTRSTKKKGVYHVVFAYQLPKAGIYAGKAALRIVKELADNKPCSITEDIEELKYIHSRYGLGPSTSAIVEEATKRKIPWRRLDNNSMILLGQGKNQQIIRSTIAGNTSSVGVDIAGDKEATKELLRIESIPVPKGITFTSFQGLDDAIREIGYPFVLKPFNGNHGRGVTTNIQNKEEAVKAFQKAQEISKYVIAEKFIEGADYRFLVINYKLVAAAKRLPAMVIGDGISTIDQLIAQVNKDPRRGDGHEKVMTAIKFDECTQTILEQKKLSHSSILPKGETLVLKDTANISTGGTSKDVTELVHPHAVFLAERIARLAGLNICGIDIIAKDITVPLTEDNGAVLEINASPGLRMHLHPSEGKPRNVAEPIIEMLYPGNSPARIPIIAVTGTNGKTTTTRLIAHIMKEAGYTTGYTTTDGIYINNIRLEKGDCSGPASAEKILRDPIVDMAVFECARGGILRSGLGFDKCDTSIITNISEDHLGLDDIESVEELAKVKAVIAESTFESGHAILNADDDLVYKIGKNLDCKVVLFSLDENSERIKAHCDAGGTAATVKNGNISVYKNGNWLNIANVHEVPLTLQGRADFMIQNVLAAVLAAVVHNIDVNLLERSLKSFVPSAEQTPGRLNIFQFRHFQLMIDYAHNKDGLYQLKKLIDQTNASVKIGIVTSPGDRRDIDITSIGECAAEIFDEIIIRHDKDTRGRPSDEITNLIREGIRKIKSHMPVTVISDEIESIQYAMNIAREDAFIVACVDDTAACIEYVTRKWEFEKSLPLSAMQAAS